MVPCHHDDPDAGFAALPHRFGHAHPDRVFAGQEAQEAATAIRLAPGPPPIQFPEHTGEHLVAFRRQAVDPLGPEPSPRRTKV